MKTKTHFAFRVDIWDDTGESIVERRMKGIYQHCSEKHLHRYLSEYDFRYNYRVRLDYSDAMRADKALEGTRAASVLLTDDLTRPRTIKQLARRFLRWRRQRHNPW
jgi:ISXO2-like transposase domain